MKFLALIPAASLFAAPVMAAPYVNIESNTGFAGSDHTATTIDNHVGYESNGWYIQAGPALSLPEGGDTEIEFSGKAGATVPANDNLDVYGELSFLTGNTNGYGLKAGAKYYF